MAQDGTPTARAAGQPRRLRHFVDGGWSETADGATSDVVDPSTGEVVATAPVGSPDTRARNRSRASSGRPVRGRDGTRPSLPAGA